MILHCPVCYDETVVLRAAVVVHEARHIRGKCVHKGSCLAGESCDPNYMNGCVGEGSSYGRGPMDTWSFGWLCF